MTLPLLHPGGQPHHEGRPADRQPVSVGTPDHRTERVHGRKRSPFLRLWRHHYHRHAGEPDRAGRHDVGLGDQRRHHPDRRRDFGDGGRHGDHGGVPRHRGHGAGGGVRHHFARGGGDTDRYRKRLKCRHADASY